ncbi:probable protein phosphatase 2C 27 isoform X2 [Solanum pennellii]|uniref:Probable protein phosphatase 2C 27 isoform X2 n=1 Tax=Solanum pennellii TaxID=28526 RepID=A0ABM1GN16_SOLPN|nr:probable protein phosphatase 2C 27 isoform X2 [Solanum pennellii]
MHMAAYTDFSPPFAIVEGSYSKENTSAVKDELLEESNELKTTSDKPLRDPSVVQYSVNSTALVGDTDLVFDGHGGTDAALFVRNNILKFIMEDPCFPMCLEKALKNAFLKADYAFADDSSIDIYSGTTALTALMFGRNMIVANAGDCRAVLGKRGKAIELSKDHKPNSASERHRIEKLGGVIYDGYLNGQLSIARALGDWHMKGPKGSAYPLSAEPELQETLLTEDDEFLIMGCDGLWDVMSSQCAVTMARKELMLHNDPERCSRELVREALKRNTCDNLTVIVICFSPDPPPRIEIPPTRICRSISVEGLNLLKSVLESNS